MGWPTVAQVVSKAARQLGLVFSNIANPLASTDPNIQQLVALLQGLGEELARQHAWTQLERLGTLSVVSGGAASFALPTDFQRIIDQTQWNATQRMPTSSGLTPQQWEQLRAVPEATSNWYKLRIFGGVINITPAPQATETIYYEYRSAWWVAETSGAVPNTSEIVAFDDELWFDIQVLVTGLKLAFRREKGFNTTAEQAAFDAAVAAARGGDGDAPVLSLNGPTGVHLIDDDNLPDEGYGQ